MQTDLPDIPRRCLVVGGGLIGSHVACELVRSGSEVALLSRSLSPWLLATPEAANIRIVSREMGLYEPSMESPLDLDSLVAANDVVFMLAGRSTPAFAARDAVGSIVESLVPTLTLLESLRRTGTRRLVIATSGGTVYGKVGTVPTPEAHPKQPISVHGINSVAIESYTDFFARAYGLTPNILRYSNVYGPGQRQRGGFAVIAAWLEAALNGVPAQIMGPGVIRRDFIYAADAAHAAVLASRLASPCAFNVGSGRSTSLAELLTTIEKVTGRSLVVDHVKARPVDVPETCLDIDRLEALTGWRPETELEHGLRLTWEWLRSARDDGSASNSAGAS